ncbi:MAG: NUDIX hydrolase [Gammaproteobacteria bacterium]
MNENASSNIVPAVGVGGLIFDGEKILLIRRNKAPASGQWSLPGGKLESGEALTAACAREIREETGLSVTVKQIVAVAERRVENFHYVIIDFLAELTSDGGRQPAAGGDVSAADWIPIADLGHYELVEGLAEIIRRTYRHRQAEAAFGLCDIGKHGVDFILP